MRIYWCRFPVVQNLLQKFVAKIITRILQRRRSRHFIAAVDSNGWLTSKFSNLHMIIDANERLYQTHFLKTYQSYLSLWQHKHTHTHQTNKRATIAMSIKRRRKQTRVHKTNNMKTKLYHSTSYVTQNIRENTEKFWSCCAHWFDILFRSWKSWIILIVFFSSFFSSNYSIFAQWSMPHS